MLELYQFELSPFSEKVRLILDYKGLEYKKVEVTPGIGQLDVYKISGQRQVPVLKDGDTVVADSTKIAFYLEDKYPDNPLLPGDPVAKGQCLLIEEWADESLAMRSRKAFVGALNSYQNFRTSFLPQNTPDLLKNVIGAVPSELLSAIGTGVGLGTDIFQEAQIKLKKDLDALNMIVQNQPYLTGEQISLADLTVAAITTTIKYPPIPCFDAPIELEGKGIPGIADSSVYELFFEWRDRIYTQYRQPIDKSNNNFGGGGSDGNEPTTIEIE